MTSHFAPHSFWFALSDLLSLAFLVIFNSVSQSAEKGVQCTPSDWLSLITQLVVKLWIILIYKLLQIISLGHYWIKVIDVTQSSILMRLS